MDMSSTRPSSSLRILRSATFRLALFYAGLFVMSAGALFATVYITATAAIHATFITPSASSISISPALEPTQ